MHSKNLLVCERTLQVKVYPLGWKFVSKNAENHSWMPNCTNHVSLHHSHQPEIQQWLYRYYGSVEPLRLYSTVLRSRWGSRDQGRGDVYHTPTTAQLDVVSEKATPHKSLKINESNVSMQQEEMVLWMLGAGCWCFFSKINANKRN